MTVGIGVVVDTRIEAGFRSGFELETAIVVGHFESCEAGSEEE